MFAPLCAPESAPRPPVSTDTSSIAPKRTGTVIKKTLPPLLKPFEASLIPSTVTLTAPPARLLYRVSPPVGGEAPGASLARARAPPRSPRGKWVTVFGASVVATGWDVVSSACRSLAFTVTVSDASPNSRLTRTSAVWLVETEMLVRVAVLNPGADTVTTYEPTARSGNRNVPPLVEAASFVIPVCASFRVIFAPATTAPVGSLTVPETAPTIRNCAQAPDDNKIVSANSPVTFKYTLGFFARGFITKPPSEMGWAAGAPHGWVIDLKG